MGLKDPAVDALVDGLVQADTRESLVTHTRALDRALRAQHLLVPNWYTKVYRVAYWDKFAHPQTSPKYGIGLFTWWVDPDKADTPMQSDDVPAVTTPVSEAD